MAKKFDCEDEPNEFMEMPCMCDCGKWFDLGDGYPSYFSNAVVCKDCNKKEEIECDAGDDDDEFQPCDKCDLPDACEDFGCAIKSGVKSDDW